MAESENIVAETAEKIFADLADAQTINHDKKGAWKAPLWQALTDAGQPMLHTEKASAKSGPGGVGAGLYVAGELSVRTTAVVASVHA